MRQNSRFSTKKKSLPKEALDEELILVGRRSWRIWRLRSGIQLWKCRDCTACNLNPSTMSTCGNGPIIVAASVVIPDTSYADNVDCSRGTIAESIKNAFNQLTTNEGSGDYFDFDNVLVVIRNRLWLFLFCRIYLGFVGDFNLDRIECSCTLIPT